MRRILRRAAHFTTVALVIACGPAEAQTRTIAVDGVPMRAWVSGITERKQGQPALILESGAGAGLDEWRPVLTDLAALAPVVAYDRRGIGESGPDAVKPTVARVNQSLRALLKELEVAPPYVLVGHSWGGALIRGFAEASPSEIAGYVFIEVPDLDGTPEEVAAMLPPADRPAVLTPVTLPPIPPDTPPGLRAEMEVVGESLTNHWADVRRFHQLRGVPAAVVIAAPPARLRSPGDVQMRLQIKHQSEWALLSSKGLIIVSGNTGHNVMRDDPALVIQAVKHVLRAQ